MGIERFLNKTVTQKRKASATGQTVEAWSDVSTTLRCCIYPMNPRDTIAFQDTYFRANITHKMHCLSSEDIKIDDKIVDGNDEYLVKKINSWGKFLDIFLSEVK